ncbi:hypothetical protein BRADI_2g04713v3, partial [Brachypodium distachyon]
AVDFLVRFWTYYSSSQKITGFASEEIILRKFVCSREGSREEKHMKREDRKRRPHNLTRVGCRAKLVIARVKETGRWFVKDFIDEHTHPLAPRDLACLLRSHRRISDEQKADIYGGYDEVGCTTREIYNFCHLYKQETVAAGDAQTVICHMMARRERDPNFFFKYLVDGEGHLKGLFWADSQSRLDYEVFGDVVVFDSTYRTNKYNLPFVPFVGLNHHHSTIVFGCGIISHETSESYEWMLRTFSAAMAQKHPISVITDGDLAMQRAIRVVWPDTIHRLYVWHIQQNIVRHLGDDLVKEEFKSFIYDRSPIEEHEKKWLDFLERSKMYQMRKLWCAPYLVGHCFLGLSNNQRSESLNSVLHTHLDGSMTLFKMLEHYERCLLTRRLNESILDIVALQSVPFTEVDASSLEKHAAQVFTPAMFALVRWSTNAASNCTMIEILDADNLSTYVVAKKDRREKKFQVHCEVKEGSSDRISCSCRKLECLGTPCSHIIYCCVPTRWTMSAKAAFPKTRKNNMYDYSVSLKRYRELRNLSHAACFLPSQSVEAYDRLKLVLNVQADNKKSSSGHKECMRYGPVLPQTAQVDSGELEKVLDPVHVQGRGAPKKRLKRRKRKRSTVKCGYCRQEGNNRRKCSKWEELSSTRLKPAA